MEQTRKKYRHLKTLSLLLLSWLILTGCNHLQVPDVPICAEVDFSHGKCAWTVTEKVIDIDDKNPLIIGNKKITWWELRTSVLFLPVESWVKIKEFVLKTCEKYPNQCVVDEAKKVVNTVDELWWRQ